LEQEKQDLLTNQQQQIQELETQQTNLLTEQTNKLQQEHQEQLRQINLIFDPQAESYETIDFTGLCSLMAT